LQFLGIEWVGINADTGKKLGLSIGFIIFVLVPRFVLRAIVAVVVQRSDRRSSEVRFWTRQGISLFTALVLIFGLLSIWFSDPTRLATAFGLVSAGLAFALQRVVTAIAGYVVILRGATFNVGDRISMGGVRGDVVALGFIQTTIMEMGEPPAMQSADPAVWVRSRQFTGRVVTVSNAKIFDEPVFNYTRDFPYIWEEIT
jgi:small-conductance mechanosensitive channel